MPKPVQGEGHVKRWNKKQPPITFRCPDEKYKERLHIQAKKEGYDSLSAFVLAVLTKHMDGYHTKRNATKRSKSSKSATVATPKPTGISKETQELMDALDEMDKAERRRRVF